MNIALDSIVVSIPACHARNRGSIPHRGVATFYIILSANITFEKGSTKDFNHFLFLVIRTCVVRINLNTNTKLPLVFFLLKLFH